MEGGGGGDELRGRTLGDGGGAGDGSSGLGSGGASDGSSGVDALTAEFARWAARARVLDAAAERSRQRWLAQQAAESSTLVGLLLDMAERRGEVTLRSPSRAYHGRVAAVGSDFCVVEDVSQLAVILRLSALVGVQPAEPAPATTGPGRRSALSMGLAEALSLLAADRQPVRVATASTETVTGELLSLGLDVLTVGTGAGAASTRARQRRVAWVPLAAVEAVTVL